MKAAFFLSLFHPESKIKVSILFYLNLRTPSRTLAVPRHSLLHQMPLPVVGAGVLSYHEEQRHHECNRGLSLLFFSKECNTGLVCLVDREAEQRLVIFLQTLATLYY